MKNTMLCKANIKRHKITMVGIFAIMMMVSLTIITVLSIWINTNTYVKTEMDRLQYGDITVWTQGVLDQEQIYKDMQRLPEIESIVIQPLVYSNYEIDGVTSDSEGQLIVYQPEEFGYRMFHENMDGYETESISINAGEIYISPSLSSTFQIAIGDDISFAIGRGSNEKRFTVKGMYEDPFMGSSMIGMKGFLINQSDYDEIVEQINNFGVDALARTGNMVHLKQSQQSTLNSTEFNQLINEETNLQASTAFVHSKEAIASFMLILQNAFTGLFLAFALILLFVSFIIVGYSIQTVLDQDKKNLAILKTVGYDGSMLRFNIKIQYLCIITMGVLMGMVLSMFLIPFVSESMILFAGIKTPSTPHIWLWCLLLMMILFAFYVFMDFKTRRIFSIPPIIGMQNEHANEHTRKKTYAPLRGNCLLINISFRQLISGMKRYISVGITAMLLVFIVSVIGRMNVWLGPDGKGMMDAFNPADLDVGVQLLGQHDQKDMEKLLQENTVIVDSYALAMLEVTVDGVDYTANVITDSNRFHIQQGDTIQRDDEIVITQTIASDRNVYVNDTISVSYNGQTTEYRIVGIYQCANEMGSNIGMSREGFLRIGKETSDMWCHHYFLEDASHKQALMDTLKGTYGGDVYTHENTWPGLYSIITAMQILLLFMYVVTALFILIVTIMTGNKVFLFEKRNLTIYKTLGFTTSQLRCTFAIRYGLVSLIGSIIGMVLSSLCTDALVSTFMKAYGISNFASNPGILSILLPAFIVSICFTLFAYLTSRNMKNLDLNELVSE